MSLSRARRRRSSCRSTSGRVTLLTAVTLAGALTLSACGDSGSAGASGSAGGNYVRGPGGISTVAKADRVAAPKLDGETVDDKTLDTTTLKGKVVVLNVWGSWCPPCRDEAKYFAKVSKELEAAGQPVAFVGINTRDNSKQNAVAFEENFGITYPSLYDPDGKLMLRFPKGTLNPQSIPSTVVLDKEGKIAARTLAAINDEQLHKIIDPLLAEK
ncbi:MULTISPECIES: TlpA disulfide reductase family protein [unclassified Streptomyces]|uniref:TlpA family protein disulfide reductase n=1 Tax=unclassified Streptomyces TaxID=2593676 RepID=UPI001BE6B230|nr:MULTISPECIES: TlpA disulfide reductase family protein [unclassified Streptomyces]MBT2406804.1 TlpA family protein disulfide reductase [Streptomyces sp. ISL-21]MBT2456660.1 TlpA family protein disulfide reductase [Streptomyces sp. ISL-86]MBT2612188.1 TlpA family protein disulfide reductase [Streptomyces sp. ISL-87]